MRYFKALIALPKGLQLCLASPAIRRVALWPWGVGFVAYLAALFGAVWLHPVLLNTAVSAPTSWWTLLIYYAAWAFFALLLFLAAGLFTVIVVMTIAVVSQTSIAVAALQLFGHDAPQEQPSGAAGLAKEAVRTISVEMLKLVWLVPLFIVLLIAGLIPFLAPLALLLGSWLLAYQFVDLILDIYKLTAWQRMRFALNHFLLLSCFGLVLMLIWALPLAGVLLVPAAQAGAVWLLNESGLLPPKNKKAIITTG